MICVQIRSVSLSPLYRYSVGQPITRTKIISRLSLLAPWIRGRLAGRQSWGWIKVSVWGLDAACGLPIDHRSPVIWMLLTRCHSFHSSAFSYSHFHFFVVSESSCRKANRFLPREDLLKILPLHFSSWIRVKMEQLTALALVPVPALFHCRELAIGTAVCPALMFCGELLGSGCVPFNEDIIHQNCTVIILKIF